MSAPVSYGSVTKKEALRWSICFAAMLLLHGGIVAAALLTKHEDDGDVLDTVTAIDVDFSSQAFKDAQARDLPPGEEQMQTDVAPPPMEKAEQKSETETPTPPLPAVENPDVALQTEPEKREEKKEDEAEKNPNATPPVVAASATTAPTLAAVRSASVVSWKRQIALQIQRNMRYPTAAEKKREQGVARVAFLMNRLGHVVSSKVIQSSGSAALDQEALDLLQRTQLPKPPADVPGNEFPLNIPVRFDLK
jgi:periplasmic protein TonB